VAVDVAHFYVAPGATECALLFARWRVGIGAIPESSIGDLIGFLAPLLPIPATPGLGQSWSSSSSSEL
jgi:hypothetical protein